MGDRLGIPGAVDFCFQRILIIFSLCFLFLVCAYIYSLGISLTFRAFIFLNPELKKFSVLIRAQIFRHTRQRRASI